MSTLAVGTIKSISSAAPVFQNTSGTEIGQLAKKWVIYEDDGSINASLGISSVDDNGGTGDHTVKFDTAFSSVNYAFALSVGRGSSSSGMRIVAQEVTKSTTDFRIQIRNPNTGGTNDTHEVAAVFFGD